MIPAPLPDDEPARLDRLQGLGLLDTPPSERFDRLTRLTSSILGVPIALVSLIDSDRQWFKSKVGLEVSQTPREVAFCAHAILRSEIFEVPDASLDPRFADNPLVLQDPSIRFYAGRPLNAPGGGRIGTLCAIDRRPRSLDEKQRQALEDLAILVEDEIAALDLAHAARGGVVPSPATPPGALDGRLLQVLDSAVKTAIIATDVLGKIFIFNSGAERLLGWSAKDMIGRTPEAYHPPEELAARKVLLSASSGKDLAGFEVLSEPAKTGGFESRECQFVRRDGSRVWVDLTVTPLRDARGKIEGYVGIAVDATARKEVDRLRDQISYHVSHELRTPAGVLSMGLSLLEEELKGKFTAEEAEHFRLVQSGSAHLQRMIADLLDVARSASGKLTVIPDNFDLAGDVADVVTSFTPLAVERGLKLTLTRPEGGLCAWADAARVRQVLTNFIDNALKFTPRGGTIVVSVQDAGGGFRKVSVKDDGPGMSPEDAKRVFDRLYQTANKASHGQAGLGLGLFIAHELVERQGGRIGVESVQGKGANFWFTVLASAKVGS
jgi:PAS domain S-box-containing protein